MIFTKVQEKMTPSGYWDNGLYEVKGTVNIPDNILKDCIIDDFNYTKGVDKPCQRITHYGKSFIVLKPDDR